MKWHRMEIQMHTNVDKHRIAMLWIVDMSGMSEQRFNVPLDTL